MKRFLFLSGIITALCGLTFSQDIVAPNYSLKSHQTLEISKIERSNSNTLIYLNLENRIAGGYFCADRNIYIIYPDGTRIRLISSEGIPVCPKSYKFKSIGEKLNFTLSFPALRKDLKWIDLVEDCPNNCFSFYGVCLDNDLNKKLDDAFTAVENKKPEEALQGFLKIADNIDKNDAGLVGLIYMNIIKLEKEKGDKPKAEEFYNKLKKSGIPRVVQYIQHLNSEGISY